MRGPVVVDADGLTHLARLGRWPGPDGAQAILTPHPKEMARLLGAGLGDVLGAPIGPRHVKGHDGTGQSCC